VEEFLFYVGGFMMVLLCYIWADEYWLASYHVTEGSPAGGGISSMIHFQPSSVVFGLVLMGAAVAYKKLGTTEASGFPWYFSYLLLVALIPSAGFFRGIKRLINWRAFSFTLLCILLVSVVWEVTLALPYGWWGYQPESMIGIKIRAWSDLPIEAVIVWLIVTVDTVITYHVVKVLLCRRNPETRTLAAFERPGVLCADGSFLFFDSDGTKTPEREFPSACPLVVSLA
jgi:hypothetical protein